MAIETRERDRDLRDRERNDLILMPRQFAWGKELTTGYLKVYVGPNKLTVSDTTERLVLPHDGHLVEVDDLARAVQQYVDVAEGEYVVLTNPSGDGKQPEEERANKIVPLLMGRQVNVPGPVSFALWPFQTVKIIKGHQLQMNQYLVARVLNEDEAAKNWEKAIVKPQTAGESAEARTEGSAPSSSVVVRTSVPRPENLSVGQLLIIKGTEVSFYMPPTGLEVVPDESGKYVREAETLEQLEYCVLVDQNGEKRFERGPRVVFPKPSETFVVVEDGGNKHRKFRALELTRISGLHVKVTQAYKEEGREYKVGEELFITGDTQPIYFPRPEHAIVKYDDRDIHYATAVPKGEGRYVLGRFNGEISLMAGPKMLLPDPRTEVIIRRILSAKQAMLWYPGNEEAVRVNTELAKAAVALGRKETDYLATSAASSLDEDLVDRGGLRSRAFAAPPARLVGDEMGRSAKYSPPRTITLDTKYDGAVAVDVWTGYAVLLVDSKGERQVVEGPKKILLEFDQSLASMSLSTGKPKTTDKLLETVYLRVMHNLVSDEVSVTTADSVGAKVKVSYRVNFAGDKDKWFNVENYVKFLCDHARSMIRNAVKKIGIEQFYASYIDIIRDTILGESKKTPEGEKIPRKGMPFDANGMIVYDVEVLGLEIGNSSISQLLVDAQHRVVQDALKVAQSRRELDMSREREKITREMKRLTTETAVEVTKLEGQKVIADLTLALETAEAEMKQSEAQFKVELGKEKITDAGHLASLEREKLTAGQRLANERAKIALEIERLMAESRELAERTKSVTPELVAALQAFGDKATVQKMADAMGPMALLGGESVAEILGKLLRGSGLENLLPRVAEGLGGRINPVSSGNSR